MPGPWEKYASTEAKPWERYGAAPPAPGPSRKRNEAKGARGPGTRPPTPPAQGMRESLPFPLSEVAARPIEGVEQIRRGVDRAKTDPAGGTSDVIRGGMNTLAPYLPVAAVAAPLATGAGLVVGTVAGEATEQGLKAAGAPEGISELGGTLAGVALGGKAAKSAPGAASTAKTAAKNTAKAFKEVLKEPGTPALAEGVGDLGVAAGAAIAGHPIIAAGAAGRGALRIRQGLQERRAARPPAPMAGSVPVEVAPAQSPAPRPQAAPVAAEPGVPSMPVRIAQVETPPVQIPPRERFDASRLGPDPIEQAPSYQAGVDALILRRKSPYPKGHPFYERQQELLAQRASGERSASVDPDDAAAETIRGLTNQPEPKAPTLADFMDELPPEARMAAAKSNYIAVKEGIAAPESAGPAYEAAGRANKVDSLVEAAKARGLTKSKAARMNAAQWAKIATEERIRQPSMKTIEQVISKLPDAPKVPKVPRKPAAKAESQPETPMEQKLRERGVLDAARTLRDLLQ